MATTTSGEAVAASGQGPTLAKICGVTLEEDAAAAAGLGVEFLGLNFWPRSKRYLAIERAPAIAAAARAAAPSCQLVGVFVNATLDEIAAAHAAARLDVVQLHGDEPPAMIGEVGERLGVAVWKAVAAGDLAAVERLDEWQGAAAILLDAPSAGRGGSGLTIDPAVVLHARRRFPALRLVLAGGMRPDNVAAAIAATAPWAVDTASGVEEFPGKKDAAKMAAFLAAVRASAAMSV